MIPIYEMPSEQEETRKRQLMPFVQPSNTFHLKISIKKLSLVMKLSLHWSKNYITEVLKFHDVFLVLAATTFFFRIVFSLTPFLVGSLAIRVTSLKRNLWTKCSLVRSTISSFFISLLNIKNFKYQGKRSYYYFSSNNNNNNSKW